LILDYEIYQGEGFVGAGWVLTYYYFSYTPSELGGNLNGRLMTLPQLLEDLRGHARVKKRP